MKLYQNYSKHSLYVETEDDDNKENVEDYDDIPNSFAADNEKVTSVPNDCVANEDI